MIPRYNEETNIEPMINQLRNLFGEYICEIIPVDDNSQEATAKVIPRLAGDDPIIKPVFRSPPNGLAGAIKDGYISSLYR